MKRNKFCMKKIIICILLCCIISTPVLGISNSLTFQENISLPGNEYYLPSPQFIEMSLEESIMRRASMRNFTDEPITDEELSTVLWSAFGLRNDGKMTIPEINNTHAVVIYVLLEDVYRYNPMNHSLILYKEGDYRDIVGWQYSAPVQLCLCWNTDIADANFGSTELGCVGQNIYFAANAIGLGTVITAEIPSPISIIGLPENESGMGVMPLGHLEIDYNFKYRPMLFSLLPRVSFSDTSLTTVLETRDEVKSWDNNTMSRVDLSYLIWSSYGYSYYLDESNSGAVERHHTVPSAHGYYPFRIYAATKFGVFRYIYGLYNIDRWGLPVVSFLLAVKLGDKRSDIALATEQFVSDAPLDIIIVLDIDKTNKWDDLSNESMRWIWYYEAGAAAHNVLLQATSRGLAGNIIPVNDKESICSLLSLNKEKFDPMLVVAVG
ncbi:MAG: nitroreductase family protein [Candidatus Thermoplasmatota archaeon]|nr:nitroreductase family protein [Candidatus Thermoplasmatota archaeon]